MLRVVVYLSMTRGGSGWFSENKPIAHPRVISFISCCLISLKSAIGLMTNLEYTLLDSWAAVLSMIRLQLSLQASKMMFARISHSVFCMTIENRINIIAKILVTWVGSLRVQVFLVIFKFIRLGLYETDLRVMMYLIVCSQIIGRWPAW